MTEHKSTVKNETQGQEGNQSNNNATLVQQLGQKSINTEKNAFEFAQMNKQLQQIQTTQGQTNYYDPYLQTNRSIQQLNQINLKNTLTNDKYESSNRLSDNSQEFMRGKGRYRGNHREFHHHHNHHHMRHHRGYNKEQQHRNQAGFSDEYWHQIQDRKQQYPSPPPLHQYNHFNPWNQGDHQMHSYLPPPPPPYFYVHNYQQQHYPYPPQPHYYQNPYYYHHQSGQNEVNPPYQYPNKCQNYQQNDRVGQQKSQNQNYPKTSNNKCENKKRWKQKNSGQQGCWMKRKCKKYSRSHSRSSSSSSEESKEKFVNEKTKLYIQQITNYYTSQLQNLFESKSINNMQRQKILTHLIDKYPKYEAPFQKILECIAYLQTQNLLHHMPYIKVIKVLIKFKFNMDYVIPKISCIQAKKIRKYQSDLKYKELYGSQQVQPPLQHGQLIDMNQSNIIYLIDGNNVLPTQKHFRKNFQSTEKYKKIEAQLRFQWLVSFALEPQNVCLFFDQKFPSEDINTVSSIIFPNNLQKERANKLKIIYGDQTIADDKIVQKLSEIKESQKQIILVSADRELYMRCMKIAKIKHTGGRFFFKFLKYVAVHRNENEKYIKKLIKTVIRNN